MKTAAELLVVIESSHLPITEKLADIRENITEMLESCLVADQSDSEVLTNHLAELLTSQGVVLGDQQDLQAVIAEYLHVVSDEENGLGDEEMSFLKDFLN